MKKLIALGANLSSPYGTPRQTLERALELLEREGVQVVRLSRWYSTPAWPPGAGPNYTNAAVEIDYQHSARNLLSILQSVENELGRIRSDDPSQRWSARVCDLDLISFESMVAPGLVAWRDAMALAAKEPLPDLVLPHPRMHSRVFVLAPMSDIAPDWRHPVLRKTVLEMIDDLPEDERIQAVPVPN